MLQLAMFSTEDKTDTENKDYLHVISGDIIEDDIQS